MSRIVDSCSGVITIGEDVRLRNAVRVLISAGVAGGMTFGLAAPASAATELVPYRMDASNQAGWWKPIDEFNGVVYMAYNAWGSASAGGANDTHTVYVARRQPDGSWTRGCMQTATGACQVFPDDLGHSQPTIAIDGDGYIHAWVAMHGDIGWNYFRSTAPGDVGAMVRATMPDPGNYTYPSATRISNGDVYLIIRAGPNGRLYRWNNAANTWSQVATFAHSSGYVVYPDDVIGDANGNVHIAWEWAYGGTGGLRHYGSYLRYSPATNRFYNAAGSAMTLPVSTRSGGVVYQPIEGSESPTGVGNAPGVQSAKVALNQVNGRPLVAYRYRSAAGGPFRVKLAEWNGSGWVRSVVYGGVYDTFAAVDISTYGASGVRVYYAKNQTNGDDHAFAATRQSSTGTWPETLLLSGVPVERLSVTRRGTIDHLYLAAPGTRQLFYGTNNWP